TRRRAAGEVERRATSALCHADQRCAKGGRLRRCARHPAGAVRGGDRAGDDRAAAEGPLSGRTGCPAAGGHGDASGAVVGPHDADDAGPAGPGLTAIMGRPLSDPLVERMRGFGTTIFAEMTALAQQTGAVNLGQGFPDTDGPNAMLEQAVEAIRGGLNQYPPGPGLPPLRQAVAAHRKARYGLTYDPDSEILVTVGATEAISAAILALCEAGDEVVLLEPYYDSYAAALSLAGAIRKPVPLRPESPGGRFTFDPQELRAAVTPRTRLILLNSPHN